MLKINAINYPDKLGWQDKTQEYTGKVDYWGNSPQKHRWVATALLEIEPRL